MKKVILFFAIILISAYSYAQFPNYVKYIESKANSTVSVKANLNQGKIIDDLSWAWSSSVACFPGTQAKKFTGNHVLFHTKLPPKAIMYITVIPKDKNANFSIYAYSIGTTNYAVVPKMRSCVSCEVEHKWDYPKKNRTQDHTRTIRLNAIKNPYNVVIGVVGADGLKSGAFKLEIKIEGGEEKKLDAQKEVIATKINCEKNKITKIKGDLKNGVIINDLSWAWSSSNACFPETQKKKFMGNHVLYVTDLPKYSEMEVTVVPDNKNADFSIYAYEIGANSDRIVPNLPSCIRCEVDHKWDYPKKGKTQDHSRTVKHLVAINNPYKVVIGVVGANGLQKGGYTLKINLKSR